MPRVLMSVYDKRNLISFATALVGMGWDIVASGGTKETLEQQGIAVLSVEQLTGIPSLLGGRVKTLHPSIHAGILAKDTEQDLLDLNHHGYAIISMVVVNLYPFQETVSQSGVSLQDAIEQIDIGGVALLRGAAKNFFRVTTVSNPDSYQAIVTELRANGETSLATRRDLAVQAFALTQEYDTAIHAYLSQSIQTQDARQLPSHLSIGAKLTQPMRYGENPHQAGAFYSTMGDSHPFGSQLIGEKGLSYNNILDIDSAWRAVSSFQDPTVVIVKHLNPIGIASADKIATAFHDALASDSVSAFGGVIATNRTVTLEFVEALESLFVEAIAAPNFDERAIDLLQQRRKNCRLLTMPYPYSGQALEIRTVHRGVLVQQVDMGDPSDLSFRVVGSRLPSDIEMESLRYAWKVVQHVKSNAIVIGHHQKTVGIAGGLPSRVDATQLALQKAGVHAQGATLASDAFFPFADSIHLAVQAGITAIIQPGGSIRDAEIIATADRAGIAMIFTGTRHFRH
ncbi:MAG: bifunctional phosphoribosylaminoimidazolecarboxamide formyltransferase/IMP cyclohydrolase [Phototrophicaceae bacterium]